MLNHSNQKTDAKKESDRICARKYYTKNKEKVVEKQKKWNKNNRDKCNKYARDYYHKNKEKCKENAKKWRINNPDKIKAHKKACIDRKKLKEGADND